MMCKCCNDNNKDCKCMHHKMWMMHGLLVVVVGVLWLLSNYEVIGKDFWMWLLPILVIVIGFKCMMMCGKKTGMNQEK